jgi:hypothetical protein
MCRSVDASARLRQRCLLRTALASFDPSEPSLI